MEPSLTHKGVEVWVRWEPLGLGTNVSPDPPFRLIFLLLHCSVPRNQQVKTELRVLMISILGSHKHCYLAFSTRPAIHRLSSAPSIRPLDSPRSRGAPCDSILTWLNGGKELASAEGLGKVEMKLGKVEKKLEMELGKVEMKLDKLEKQVAGIQSSLGLLSEGDLRAKASRRHLVGESIEIEHVEGLVG